MATPIMVPSSAELGAEIILARWLVRPGDAVEAGMPLAEIEADKGVLAVESPEAGTLLAACGSPGDTMAQGAILGYVGRPGEKVPGPDASEPQPAAGKPSQPAAEAVRPSASARPGAAPAPAAAAARPAAGRVAAAPGAGPPAGRVAAAPATRRLAESLGVNLVEVPPTGPGGIVTPSDVEAAARGLQGRDAAWPRRRGTIACRIVDLSHRLIPGKEEYGLTLETHDTTELYPQYKKSPEVWYILQDIHMSSHCGTHIEFPYHHNRHGLDAGGFPLERLVCPAVLLDFRHKRPGEAVTAEELIAQADKIRTGDAVLFNFGCARLYRTERSHDRPYLTHEAVRWLIFEKKVNLVGSDASGIEIKGVPNQPNHQLLMDNQVPIIEFAANLDALAGERFTLLALALCVEGLDSCPVRLIAIEDQEEESGR